MASATTRLSSRASADASTLELVVQKVDLPELKEDEVLIKIEAAPLNPSDIGTILGSADPSTAKAGPVNDGLPSCVMDVKYPGFFKGREGKDIIGGNEGAGRVVKAGSSPEAQLLLGCLVGVIGGACYSEYKVTKVAATLAFPEGTTAAQAASWFVNPLTASCFVETMRAEGHKAIVHTAAASNLGQMLAKLCIADGVDLVCIVRKKEQEDILKGLGVKYIVNSSSEDFEKDLSAACKATGATLAFDAIGSGDLVGKILSCMEYALTDGKSGVYGSTTHKQVYIYGKLGSESVSLPGRFGLSWGVGGWLLNPCLGKLGPEVATRLKQRVAKEIGTTFASSYFREVTLAEAVDPEVVKGFAKQATGEKYLVTPFKGAAAPST